LLQGHFLITFFIGMYQWELLQFKCIVSLSNFSISETKLCLLILIYRLKLVRDAIVHAKGTSVLDVRVNFRFTEESKSFT
jgi:hypothetical protein